MDSKAIEEINKVLTENINQQTLDVLIEEAQERAVGKEVLNDPDYQFTDRDKIEIEKEFEKGFVNEFRDQLKEIGDRAKERESAAKEESKSREDNRTVSDLKGEEARQMEEHMLKVTKESVEKYREIESKEERKRALEEVEDQIEEFPEGSKRRMELEAEKRGLMVSNILVDGPDAEGVGPSMSVLIQAAEKLGKLDSFLDLNLLGGENTAESQQQFRDVLKEVGVHNLTEFMDDDNPAVSAVEVLSDPGFVSRASSEIKSELEEMIIDSVISGVIFTDAALEEKYPNSTVSKKNKAKIKSPQADSVWERLRKMLEKLKNL
jgi:ABC-type transporter MlaC component